MSNILVTGCAGFVANSLIIKLLERGHSVFGIDNLSRGNIKNIEVFKSNENFNFFNIDLSNFNDIDNFFSNHKTHFFSEVWHLAANSDIEQGSLNIDIDQKNTYLTTFNIIKCMVKFNCKEIYFASSSAVYGDHADNILSEESSIPIPISNYGAMKLASESIIYSAAEIFLEKAIIFRFPNVVGAPSTHGVIYDFVNKLILNPNRLDVLGNGSQQKSYLHVSELIDAILFISDRIKCGLNIFNVGPDNDDGISVKSIADLVVKKFSPEAKICYGKTNKGWVGDVPKFKYSIEKLKKLGWYPKLNSYNSVIKAIDDIYNQFF